jgi:hypothetical protein
VTSTRALSLAVWPVLLLAGAGCAGGAATYGQDRLRDVADVADLRYGTGLGLGASVEAVYFGTGLGCSTEWYQRQWFGRKSVEVRDGLFAHGLIVGFDGDYVTRVPREDWLKTLNGSSSTGSADLLIFHGHSRDAPLTGNEQWFSEPGGDPPLLANLRVGGALFLPIVNGGLYFNLGEVIDLFGGIVGYDPMHDDGIPKYVSPPVEPPIAPPADEAEWAAPVAPPEPK